MKVKTLDSLRREIFTRVNESLTSDVAVKVREVEQAHIQSDVYDVYSPSVYQRRMYAGGLIADQNITSELVKDGVLAIENKTPYKSARGFSVTLAELVEHGYPGNKNSAPYQQPRPFTENTCNDLKENRQHIEALKNGLSKRGLRIK